MTVKGPEDPRIGSTLAERYRIDALIGEGGMGRVYSAEHVMMKKRLAVKVLRRELTVVPEVVARFEREAMAAANIDHPNVAAATDFGKLADGSVYLVLEFVMGASLRDEIAEGPLPVPRALHIARQMAAGLAAAHLQGIVHRDLKPENVMLVERGPDPDFVKVLDFGIAKVPIGEVPQSPKDQPITKAGMVFGTPEYMSPEQALGQGVDGRADLYSLGVILFEMLSGVRPFSSANAVGILGQQLASPPPSLIARAPSLEIPPAVEQLVTRLLARDRDQRYAKATDVVRAIDVLLNPAPRGRRPADAALRAAPHDVDTEESAPHSEPGPGSARGLDRLRVAISSIMPPADVLRERLPARIRESLRPVETRTLLVATAVAAVVVVGLSVAVASVWLSRSRSPETPPKAQSAAPVPTPTPSAAPSAPVPTANPSPVVPPSRALSAELEVAARQGAPALEQLATKYPLDPEPLTESARAWVAAKDYVRATGAVGRALALDPNLSRNDRIAAVLYQAAQDRASADAAFALLQGPMSARGAEIQWDLAVEPAIKPWVRSRAGQWLRSPGFRRVAPPSLTLAADLRTAANCEAARALLPKAKDLGDERSLSQLQAWQRTTGCGKNKAEDCMPCLRRDDALKDAVTAIQQRKKPD